MFWPDSWEDEILRSIYPRKLRLLEPRVHSGHLVCQLIFSKKQLVIMFSRMGAYSLKSKPRKCIYVRDPSLILGWFQKDQDNISMVYGMIFLSSCAFHLPQSLGIWGKPNKPFWIETLFNSGSLEKEMVPQTTFFRHIPIRNWEAYYLKVWKCLCYYSILADKWYPFFFS